LQKYVTRSQLKLDYVWNLIIQGDTVDINSANYETMESTEKEFIQNFYQFPNCRYILYSKFKLEICSDVVKYQELQNQYISMQKGLIIFQDIAHPLGIMQFPNLPLLLQDKTDFVSNQTQEIDDDRIQELKHTELSSIYEEQILAVKEKIQSLFFWN
jgi:hypothetical protein